MVFTFLFYIHTEAPIHWRVWAQLAFLGKRNGKQQTGVIVVSLKIVVTQFDIQALWYQAVRSPHTTFCHWAQRQIIIIFISAINDQHSMAKETRRHKEIIKKTYKIIILELLNEGVSWIDFSSAIRFLLLVSLFILLGSNCLNLKNHPYICDNARKITESYDF